MDNLVIENAATTTIASGYYDYTPTYWPIQTSYWISNTIPIDRAERAFRVAKMLVNTDRVSTKSVKQFIELVEAILKEL